MQQGETDRLISAVLQWQQMSAVLPQHTFLPYTFRLMQQGEGETDRLISVVLQWQQMSAVLPQHTFLCMQEGGMDRLISIVLFTGSR
jgi:hypothetical protein